MVNVAPETNVNELFWGLAERLANQEYLVDTLIKRIEAVEDRLVKYIRDNGKKKAKVD